MTALLFILVVLAAQAFVVSRAWLGAYAPDPLVLLAGFAALYWPRRSVLVPVVLLGWVRALVLLEPAGGQVACALAAMVLVVGLRSHLLEHGHLGYVLGTLLVAGCWSLVAALTGLAFGVDVTGGRELVLGGVLSLPLAGLAVAAGRRLDRQARWGLGDGA